MFRTGVYIALLLGVLQDADTQTTNLTTEVLSIVECFTENEDKPWQFSEVEQSNVTKFQSITNGRCDSKNWRIFECYYPLVVHINENVKLITDSNSIRSRYFETFIKEYGEKALELLGQANEVLQQVIFEILQIKTVAAAKNKSMILNDSCSRKYLNANHMQNAYVSDTESYENLKEIFQINQLRAHIKQYFLFPFVIIVLICGTLGNGLLLLVFVRHPETRTGPNTVLINLAISDALFLVVNISLDYSAQLWGFPFGTTMCYVYTFALTFITGGSVYSMVMLSFSRYIAVTAKPGKKPPRFLSSVPAILAVVWLLASLVAIPDTLTSNLDGMVCHAGNLVLNAVPDFLLISFLPLVVITGFYIPASRRLRKSAQNIPGEAIGQDKIKTARERGARILPALTIVFAITYLPFYTFWLINGVFHFDSNKSSTIHILYFLVYFLFNLNSTLNPVALYIASSMFRKHFNKYLTLGLTRNIKSPDKPVELRTASKEQLDNNV